MLAEVREEWLAHGLSTQPADRKAAEEGVAKAYLAAGFRPPNTIVWCDSPLDGAREALYNCRWDTPDYHVSNRVVSRAQFDIRDEVHNEAHRRMTQEAWSTITAEVWDPLDNQLRRNVYIPILDEVAAKVRTLRPRHAAGHDGLWLGLADAYGRLGFDVSPMDGLMQVARSAGWWWQSVDKVVLTERPTAIHRDSQNRLHNETGPAVVYPDGFGVYAIRGVRVPKGVVTHPDLITGDHIAEEPNTEVRRIMLERFGYERYIAHWKLVPISTQRVPCLSAATCNHTDEQHTARLYVAHLDGDEPLAMLQVYNSTPEPDGSIKQYWLRVPPTMQTAREAIAWTFGMQPRQYKIRAQS